VLIQFAQQLAGSIGTPLTRLFGQSPVGLNATGEGEMKQYHEKVKQRQERKLRNPLHRLLAVMSMSSLGKPLPDDFQFQFRNLQEMSEAEKADIAQKNTDALTKAVDSNIMKLSAAMKALKALASVTGLFSSIKDEDIKEAEQQEKDVPPPSGRELPMPDLGKLSTAYSFLKRFSKRR